MSTYIFFILIAVRTGSSYARTAFWHCRDAPRIYKNKSQPMQAWLSLLLVHSHRCPRRQLICQNCVLALSRRSSNIQEQVPAHASMAVTSSCTFSSLSAQKKSDGKLTLPSLFLKKYEGEKMFSLLHHNTTYFVIC